mgnify:CR=1 FL=1
MNQTEAFHRRIDEALNNPQMRDNFRAAMDGIMARRAEQFPDDTQLQAFLFEYVIKFLINIAQLRYLLSIS